ncbi:MAG: NAD(P)-dependent oxidoreductase [Acidimicrobiales bacterium]
MTEGLTGGFPSPVGGIVALGPVPDSVQARLAPFGSVTTIGEGEECPAKLLSDAVALIARGSSRVTAELLEAAPHLRVIGRSGVGVELVDVAAATRRGIPIVVTPGTGSRAVAEGALALILSLVKRLGRLTALVQERGWAERETIQVGDLDEACLGIIGYGAIGRRVAELGRCFGMRVLVYDPYTVRPPVTDGIVAVDLEVLFQSADVVSLHAPLTDETRGLVGVELLALLQKGAVLVNCGRGGLLDLDAVHEALLDERLAGVGLDVFDPEPPPDHPLFRHPDVVLTPHVLGLSRRARRLTFEAMAEGIAAVLSGTRAPHVANPEVYGVAQ